MQTPAQSPALMGPRQTELPLTPLQHCVLALLCQHTTGELLTAAEHLVAEDDWCRRFV